MKQLLSISNDSKTSKGESFGYLTGILYLAPASESGVMNVCPHASEGCRLACLFTAGRGSFNSVRTARIAKTVFFKRDRQAFVATLVENIQALVKKAAKAGLKPAVRLNGTSDLPWHKIPVGDAPNIMSLFPDVPFYDYTPNPTRIFETLPANYSLTFSRKEDNHAIAQSIAASGANVAVVFAGKALPATFFGRPVFNGDASDLRFLDPRGVIVGLSAKGKGRKDTSGFVVHATN
jgi:hypothetical protein